ncbi:hypothetical protein [Myxococcus sp. AB025B]|nr:hypothetical protein [Myxococcus sp. AB025B]
MTTPKNFDMETTLRLLDEAGGHYEPGSKEDEAIQLAGIALLYLRHTHQMDAFFQYRAEFSDPTSEVRVSQDFATRALADEWLASGAGTHGELVRIEGQGFQVVALPTEKRFLRTPLPEELGPPRP